MRQKDSCIRFGSLIVSMCGPKSNQRQAKT
jgi:hypothetical protein